MATNKKQTGRQAASDASKLLRSKKTAKIVRTVAGSDLSQTPLKKKPGKRS